MTPEKYGTSDQLRRACRAIVVLAGHTVNGLAPGELAKAVDASPSNITRLLANLKQEGFVEKIEETGRWRLGPKVVQIALAFSQDLSRARSRLDEVSNRYTRLP